MKIYKSFEDTPYYDLIETQVSDIKKTIVDNSSASSKMFTNHLFKLAKNEHLVKMTAHKKHNDRVYGTNQITFAELNKIFPSFQFTNQIMQTCDFIAQSYMRHKQLFKQAYNSNETKFHFRPLETSSLESLQDGISRVIHNNEVKKYAHSFLRSYKNLMDEGSYNLFDSIMEKDLDRSFVQNEIRKVASFKNSEDLNNVLTKITQSEHSVDYILNKINENNLDIDILHQSEKSLVINVNDFEASQSLGSGQWCISTQENYFEEYLYNHNAELGDNYNIDEATVVKGYQLFIFDFEKEASDPLFMVGATISANGTIVAAHDKNDENIFDEVKHILQENSYNTINNQLMFIKGKSIFSFDLEEVVQKIPFDRKHAKEEILSDIYTPESIFEKEGAIFYNTINPLNMFLEINEENSKKGQELFLELTENINFNSSLIKKSIEDYFRFKTIDSKTMVEDILNAYTLVSKLEEYEKNYQEVDEDEEYDMSESDIEFNIEIRSDSILTDHAVRVIFNDLSDLEKTIIFKENKELMMDVLNDFVIKLEHGNSLKSLENSSGTIPRSFKSALNSFSTHLINHIDSLEKKTDTIKNVRDILVFEHCIKNENPKKEILKDFIKLVEDGKIHANKVFGNIEQFSKSFKDYFSQFINDNNNVISGITNKILQPLSCDRDFIESLNEKTCVKLNESIKSNKINFGNLNDEERFFKSGEFSFAERMKKLKDKGIVDDDIINTHYNSSQVAFGNKKNEHLFLAKESPKTKIKLR
jgi:Txe/YoeB family toxin of Txe-Axe toxin-antitoxin module